MPAKRAKKTKTTFELELPSAASVHLAGEFTNWENDMILLKKGKKGTWKTTVSLPPGNHEYRFLVDGQWCDDPSAATRTNNPFGSKNCVRKVVAG